MYNPQDFYFKQAKKSWYKARSAFKLDEIDQKFHIFDKKTKTVLDIWCAPWSWLQYTSSQLLKLWLSNIKLIWFDLKKVDINIPYTHTYVQDIWDESQVQQILNQEKISQFDVIISDMAPNTIWVKEVDAIRSIALLEKTLWIYKKYLSPSGKFVIKIFMWPWFDEFVLDLKKTFGGKNIKLYKPKACRAQSKETYIIKI